MQKKILYLIPVLLAAIVTFTGCGGKKDENVTTKTKEYGTLKNNTYYVRHQDGSLDEVYMGDTSYEKGNVVKSVNTSRSVWFKEDYKKIPTLYVGDELIFYSVEELTEEFNFERFKDLGYTLGVRKLTRSPSGRLKISTDTDDKTTYPGGDTDVILGLTNKKVIIESVASVQLRIPEEDDEKEDDQDSPITEAGTLKNFEEGRSYDVKVFDGTEGHDYIWTADVRAFGAFEVDKTSDFMFESDTVIVINIPKYFHSGYYCINGAGLFRYINTPSITEFNEDVDMNIPNVIPETSKEVEVGSYESNDTYNDQGSYSGRLDPYAQDNGSEQDSNSNLSAGADLESDDIEESTFNLPETGEIRIQVTVEDGVGTQPVKGIVISPSDKHYVMAESDGNLFLSFYAEEVGTYKIKLSGLNGRQASVSVDYQE